MQSALGTVCDTVHTTIASALAIKTFAVAGREKRDSCMMSTGRHPLLIPLT